MTKRPLYQGVFLKSTEGPVKCVWNPRQIRHCGLTYHHEFELHYIKRGHGSYFIKNKNYPFAKNHLIIIKSGEIHSFIMKNSSYIEKGSLYFSLSIANKNRELAAALKKCPHLILFPEQKTPMVEIIFKNIADETNKKECFWEKIVYAELSRLLFMIQRYSLSTISPVWKNPLTEKIIDYLEQNFASDLSLSDIAKTFSLSVSHISHTFKKSTGLSLKQYMLQRRIIEAKKMLDENPDRKISTLSASVGFNNFSLFNRMFKKFTCTTPANYRRILQQKSLYTHTGQQKKFMP